MESNYFHILHYAFPLLPWFGLYFIGSYFGEQLGCSSLEKDNSTIIIKYFLKIGLCSVAAAVSVKMIFLLFNNYFSWPIFKNFNLFALTSPIYKSPPSTITYFLFYGGISLLFIGFLPYFEQKKWLSLHLKMTATIGKSSLFIFITQYYFYTILYAMHLHYSQCLAYLFLVSSVLHILAG